MQENELTPQEIAALTTGELPSESVQPNHEAAKVGASSEARPAVAAPQAAWDDRIMQAYRAVIDSFANRFAKQLAPPLRTEVTITVESVREAIFGEMAIRMDNPTCVQLMTAEPLASEYVCELHPTVLFPIFDRLLGGGNLPAPMVRRPLTEIETRLAGRVTRILTAELMEAWSSVISLQIQSAHLSCNPRLIRSENPNEPMIVAQFRLTMDGCDGPFQLAIRKSTLLAIRDQFLEPQAAQPVRTHHVEVTVGEIHLTRNELQALTEEDVLVSAGSQVGQSVVWLDGAPAYAAALGTAHGKKAVGIQAGL
jgi:flagellar motor switch protein FliM